MLIKRKFPPRQSGGGEAWSTPCGGRATRSRTHLRRGCAATSPAGLIARAAQDLQGGGETEPPRYGTPVDFPAYSPRPSRGAGATSSPLQPRGASARALRGWSWQECAGTYPFTVGAPLSGRPEGAAEDAVLPSGDPRESRTRQEKGEPAGRREPRQEEA